jgi:hypothetical protein
MYARAWVGVAPRAALGSRRDAVRRPARQPQRLGDRAAAAMSSLATCSSTDASAAGDLPPT